MKTDDWRLLCQYAQRRSNDAFATLVHRHVNLVYSVALRQVRSPHLAQEVAQSVFTDLARNAATLRADTILTAWLYRVAYRTAIDVVRHESRRQAREQIAMEMAAMNAPSSEWTGIEPLLDEAMEVLDPEDRTAVLLRYFDNKSLRDVGQALGVSEDAAQKRVSRAVDRLRELFSKRGVIVGSAGLAVVISANAVQAAPAGLAATISAAATLAGTTTVATTTATITKAVAMTALQKTLVTATIAATVSAGIYEAHRASTLRDQVQSLQQQQQEIQRLQREKDSAVNRLSSTDGELQMTMEDSNELVRLRAEAAGLREQVDVDASELRAARDFQSRVSQIYSNTPPVQKFVSTTATTVSWGQAIITGGWKTPSGKRVIVLLKVLPVDAAGQVLIDPTVDTVKQVLIDSTVLEYTEEAGAAVGLTQFDVDASTSQKAHRIDASQLESILTAAKADNSGGINILSAPKVTTVSEQQAQIRSESPDTLRTPSGETYSAGEQIDVIPSVSPDGQSVHVVTTAQLNYLIDLPTVEAH